MNQNTIDRLIAEWETISKTAFWSVFTDKIREKRAVDSRMCETNKEVTKHQGAISAWDIILGREGTQLSLPEQILEDLRRENSKEE